MERRIHALELPPALLQPLQQLHIVIPGKRQVHALGQPLSLGWVPRLFCSVKTHCAWPSLQPENLCIPREARRRQALAAMGA